MKKFLIFLSLLIGTTVAFVPAVAQETMTVYDGEATSSHVPVFGLYADAYTKCQMIMPASELSDLIDGTISKLTWYLASPAAAAWGGNFQIYISEVSQATCPSVDFLDISGATLVYEGPLDGTGETMEIVFTQGYTYGGGNLLISVYETETGSWKAATFSGTTVTGASVSGYSYSGFEYVLASYRDFLPKTTFTYAPLGGVVYHKPKHLAASDITTNSATITWDAGDDETSWGVEYKKAADEEWTSAGTVTEKTIALDALANGVKYDVRVKSIYANGDSGWVQISFSTFACEETDMGEVAYTLTDTYGDGWSNCKLQVYIAGTDVLVQELTMVDDPNTLDDKEITGTFKLCYGVDYDLVWVAGKFAYECGYVLTKPNGEIIAEFHGNGSSGSPTTGVLTTFQINMEDSSTPFVTTPSPTTLPIHWYQLKVNNKYVYYDPEGDIDDQIQLSSTASTENNFLWCFVQTSPDKILIYNRAAKKYLKQGQYLESDINNSRISYVEEKDDSGFYICYFHTGDNRKYYLYETNGGTLGSTGIGYASTFNAIEILVEEETVPVTDVTLTPYNVYTPNNVQTDPAEDYYKLFDKNKSTKWCVDNSTGSWETIWVDFKSNVAFIPTSYTMTTGNDTQSWSGRNPKKWKIYAKAKESDSWTTIVDVNDGDALGLGTVNTTDYSFNINGITKKYQFFRFEVSEVRGKGGWQNNHYVFQLAELALSGYTSSSAIPGDVNGDGVVTSVDVTALYNYLLNNDSSAIVNGDQDGDGVITSVDITIIYNILLGN
ncbi:MAG: fibronectin type III domain-containing protein [Muribaculaceae bacterium]|nr:fibronectin type III domain-containing protein [Muribaculaceae bacterium]